MQWLYQIHYPGTVIRSVLTGSPSTISPLGLRITMTTWAWKVMISTGPWSIIFPIANYNTGRGKWSERKTLKAHLPAGGTWLLSLSAVKTLKSDKKITDITAKYETVCEGWCTRETLTSMLSMSRILDWKSSPKALACWMGCASWLYVWGQKHKNTFGTKNDAHTVCKPHWTD